MRKEIDIDKYNELCDRIRSVILYAEAFKKRNSKKRANVQEFIELVRKDGIELVNRVKSLEKLVDSLYNEVNKDGS